MGDSTDRPVLAASAAVFRDGRVLIARRARPGLWSLPGGRVERGEGIAAAAIREVREETGVDAEIAGFAGHREIVRRDRTGAVVEHYVVAAFAARWRSGEAAPGQDTTAVAWVAPDALADYETTEGLAEIIDAARGIIGV